MLIGAVVIIGLVTVFIRSFFTEATQESAFYKIKKSDFLVTIVEGGTLEAVKEVVIRNEMEGREARIIHLVPEGSYVKTGDLLVELDTGEALERFNQQELAYEQAKSAFVQAEQGLEIQKSVIQSGIDAANLNVEFAQIDLEKYDQADRARSFLDEEINITTTTSSLLLAKDKLAWSEKLFEKGFESKNNVDNDKNSVLRLTLELKKAQTNFWALEKFEDKKLIRQYESNLEEAKKELERVKTQGQSKLAQLQADLITQSNRLELTRKKVETDKKQLEKSKILAPQDGLVVYAAMQSRFSSQSMIEEGAMIRNQQPLIKLPDTSKMKVTIKVHESHVNKVHPGQPAFVVLDPLPDQRFKAQVTKVSVLPNTQERFGNPNLKVYDTEILIQDELVDMKPGVSARAEIIITNVPNALTVPIQAVTSLKGTTVAFVKKGNGSEPVPVEVGMFNTKFIEITSGLSEGDFVMLAPPYDAEEQDLGGSMIGADEKVDPEALRSSMPEVVAPLSQQGRNEAGQASREGSEPGRRGEGAERGGFDREAMMKRFDTNGDGEIDESERAALRQQFGGGGGGAGNRGGSGGRRGGGGAGGAGTGGERPRRAQQE